MSCEHHFEKVRKLPYPYLGNEKLAAEYLALKNLRRHLGQEKGRPYLYLCSEKLAAACLTLNLHFGPRKGTFF